MKTVEWGAAALFLGLGVLLGGCESLTTSPSDDTTTWTEGEIRAQLAASNLDHPAFSSGGRLVRWATPIEVNTNGVARAEEAVVRTEALTGGLISFRRVSGIPRNGIVFQEGNATEVDGTPGCGHVSSIDNPQWQIICWRSPGLFTGAYIVHLGSSLCDDTQADDYPSAIGEHELAHALGLNDHFEGFHGGGLRSPNLLNVLYNLYLNPPGATADQLAIRRISVGELGDF